MEIAAQIDSVEGKIASLEVWEMSHSDLKAVHTFGDDRKVRPVARKAPASASAKGISYTLPKHSLTILKTTV